MLYDVIIIGGGPSGLSAALALGRARKRVLLCDSGPRRNAAAVHMQNFVTRDGTPPEEFRRLAREQFATYPNVEVRDVRVEAITGTVGAFTVRLSSGTVEARRILLATGLVDEMLPIEGFRELWGKAIFQCPYCHGWEIKHQRWGYLVLPHSAPHMLPFAMQARGWSREVTLFTNGAVDVPPDDRRLMEGAGIRIETRPIAGFAAPNNVLEAVRLSDGTSVPCEALFTHPPQRQVELVRSLGIALDDDGYVKVDPQTRETSVPGIYASGDLTTRMQAAILAAAAGMQVASAINVAVTVELAVRGELAS